MRYCGPRTLAFAAVPVSHFGSATHILMSYREPIIRLAYVLLKHLNHHYPYDSLALLRRSRHARAFETPPTYAHLKDAAFCYAPFRGVCSWWLRCFLSATTRATLPAGHTARLCPPLPLPAARAAWRRATVLLRSSHVTTPTTFFFIAADNDSSPGHYAFTEYTAVQANFALVGYRRRCGAYTHSPSTFPT